MRSSPFLRVTLALCLILLLVPFTFAANNKTSKKAPAATKAGQKFGPSMSAMGQLAQRVARAVNSGHTTPNHAFAVNAAPPAGGLDECIDEDSCGDDEAGYSEGPAGGQGETSIAIDSTGQHIVVGFNDQRGFSLNPTSVSGYAYSDDGGATFTDGGLLPITVAITTLPNGTKVPQSFGDPDVKYLGGCTFLYAVIMVRDNPAQPGTNGTAQTMGVHRSTDCGHTWTGPYEVPAATNPHGVQSGLNARDSADKEQIGVDPKTGRVMLTWTNFTSTAFAPRGREISATYSDDAATATPPTWSARAIIGKNNKDGQASVPRFDAHSNNVYVVWEQFSATVSPSFGGLGENIGFARSTDNGVTWEAEKSLRSSDTFTMDYNLGNDRVHNFPSLEVDNSSGPNSGTVYVVQADNRNNDGSDIAFLKSTDGGLTWSAPVLINARPGSDRSQWFPYVTVDRVSGRVWVTYDDQGIASTGDLMEMSYQYSDDGGATWSRPVPFSAKPFHAGWGNDTGQPNLGDYNQSVAQSGNLYAEYALASLGGFTDGEPAGNMTTLDAAMGFVPSGTNQASLRLGAVTYTESGGNGRVDAGDRVFFNIPLTNYVTNVINAGTISSISATLTSTTPGVSILRGGATYPNLGAGASGNPSATYVVQLSPTYVPGTPLNLTLNVSSSAGTTKLIYDQATGTPLATQIFAENFNGAGVGTLPAGWSNLHGGGANTVPWTTSNTFCGASSNAAFHQNANDNGSGNPTRFERLLSPLFSVPANAQDVTIDMDVCYDTEDDQYGQLFGSYGTGAFNWLAYDGFTLRLTHFADANTVVRSVLAEAFEEELTTGGIQHFPKHFPRNSSTSYFQDMSAWAGYSNGFQHVRMRLPGMQGTLDQLRFEYTQDGGGTCADLRPGHPCGVMVDNIVINSIVYVANELATLTLRPTTTKGLYTGTLTTQAVAPSGGVTATLSSSAPSKTTMPASVTIPVGSTTSGSFSVQIDPTYTGVPVTITATGPSNSRSATVKFF